MSNVWWPSPAMPEVPANIPEKPKVKDSDNDIDWPPYPESRQDGGLYGTT